MMKKHKTVDVPTRLDDLLYYLFTIRRKLFIIAISVGITISGLYTYKSYCFSNENYLKSNISKDRQKEIESIAAQENLCQSLIDTETKYIEHSLIMSLNWTNVSKICLHYFIEQTSNIPSNISNLQKLLLAYEGAINNDIFYKDLASETGISTDDLAEILQVSKGISNYKNSYLNASVNSNIESKKYYGILTITIIGPNTSFCEKIEQKIDDYFTQINNKIANEVCQHNIEKVAKDSTTGSDYSIHDKQMNILSAISTNKKKIETLGTGLTSTESALLNVFKSKDNGKIVTFDNYYIKKLVLIIFGGIIFAVLYGCLKYLNSSKITNIYRFEDDYNIRLYAVRKQNVNKISRFDEKVNYKRYKNIHLYNYLELIKTIKYELIGNETFGELKRIYVMSSASTNNINELNTQFTDEFQNDDIQIIFKNYTTEDKVSLVNIQKSDLVIVIEELETSAKINIDKEIDYLEDSNCTIFCGVVII